ncbi:MAG TPA: NADH:flavin oxidoreductase/NADH oxidase [Oligoflexus sp.]|uniref:NADH:flavin oxidoreductase/NADH oxidase n=1 Tax=Oligoflexus sp. TaxID=1971216 RepID=UPI002D2350E4|nr:NADH:flavin oxidoreductase/NADH oxidase [Oligoflexus sp.]HYX31873.1 NADH:flavin oxidoreductase/NADH oxidase [Oligoflexus sp.]
MSHLFEPLKLRTVTLRNRIAVSPMCQYSCHQGFATDWHLVHLGSRAVGGAGLVMVEATAVTPEGRITDQDLGLWSDAHAEPLARIARFVREQGAVPGIQIAHAGRKASRKAPWLGDRELTVEEGRWQVIGPSALPFSETYATPEAMSVEQIQSTIAAFTKTAERALAAGFQFLEVHAAHGYLLNSFLSPLSNQRQDAYGGSFDNRCRMLIETVRAVRKVWPESLPLAVRLSCSDWVEDGWTIEDSITLAQELKKETVDLIDCSSGGLSSQARITVGANYQVPFAEAIRRRAGIATGAVGMITQSMQADAIIRNEQADLVLFARELLRDPYWPLRAQKELHAKTEALVPKPYARAFPGQS